jgi:hypothetical protein
LKSLGQAELASSIFVRLLEAYRESQQEDETRRDPRRSALFLLAAMYILNATIRALLLLQLVMQIQTTLTDSKEGQTNMLTQPGHILTFIKHALENTRKADRKLQYPRQSQVPSQDVNSAGNQSDSDSDDESPDSEAYTPDDEMAETSITLLLSVLEGEPSILIGRPGNIFTFFSKYRFVCSDRTYTERHILANGTYCSDGPVVPPSFGTRAQNGPYCTLGIDFYGPSWFYSRGQS